MNISPSASALLLKRFSRFRLEDFDNAYSDRAVNRRCGNYDRSCGKSRATDGIKQVGAIRIGLEPNNHARLKLMAFLEHGNYLNAGDSGKNLRICARWFDHYDFGGHAVGSADQFDVLWSRAIKDLLTVFAGGVAGSGQRLAAIEFNMCGSSAPPQRAGKEIHRW